MFAIVPMCFWNWAWIKYYAGYCGLSMGILWYSLWPILNEHINSEGAAECERERMRYGGAGRLGIWRQGEGGESRKAGLTETKRLSDSPKTRLLHVGIGKTIFAKAEIPKTFTLIKYFDFSFHFWILRNSNLALSFYNHKFPVIKRYRKNLLRSTSFFYLVLYLLYM